MSRDKSASDGPLEEPSPPGTPAPDDEPPGLWPEVFGRFGAGGGRGPEGQR